MKLNVTLDEKASKAFEDIKKHMGFHHNQSVVGLMISREKDRIWRSRRHKVFLPNETYDKAEKAAEAQGLTIHEYIDNVTEDLLKQKQEQVAEQKA